MGNNVSSLAFVHKSLIMVFHYIQLSRQMDASRSNRVCLLSWSHIVSASFSAPIQPIDVDTIRQTGDSDEGRD